MKIANYIFDSGFDLLVKPLLVGMATQLVADESLHLILPQRHDQLIVSAALVGQQLEALTKSQNTATNYFADLHSAFGRYFKSGLVRSSMR